MDLTMTATTYSSADLSVVFDVNSIATVPYFTFGSSQRWDNFDIRL